MHHHTVHVNELMFLSLQKSPAQEAVSDQDPAGESSVADTIRDENRGTEETVSETQPIVSKLKEAQQESEVLNGSLTETNTQTPDVSVLQREPDNVAPNKSCDGDKGTLPCAEPA